MNFYILFLFKKRLTVLSLSRVEHKSKFQVKKRVPQFIIAVTLRTSDDINGHLIRMRCKHLDQCFSTFFDSWHTYVATELFGYIPGFKLLVNWLKVQKFAAPLELFRAPKGSAAPRLRTTDLEEYVLRFVQLLRRIWRSFFT